MANKRITELVAASSLNDADLIEIVQSGANLKATIELLKNNIGILKKKVTVTSAQLLTLGTVPVTIIAAPGANKYLNIQSVCVSYNYGSVAYDFSINESPYLFIGSGNWTGYQIPYTTMNGGADFIRKLYNHNALSAELTVSANTALTLGTGISTDPTQGDGDLDLVVYYSIEDVNV